MKIVLTPSTGDHLCAARPAACEPLYGLHLRVWDEGGARTLAKAVFVSHRREIREVGCLFASTRSTVRAGAWVEPALVCELAFEAIQHSTRHSLHRRALSCIARCAPTSIRRRGQSASVRLCSRRRDEAKLDAPRAPKPSSGCASSCSAASDAPRSSPIAKLRRRPEAVPAPPRLRSPPTASTRVSRARDSRLVRFSATGELLSRGG